MSTVRKALALLTPRERRQGLLVLALVILTAFFEVAGVASIFPFLGVLADPSAIHENAVLRAVYTRLGFSSPERFLFFLGGAAFVLIVMAATVRTVTLYAINRFTHMRRHSIGARLLETYLRQPYEFYLNRHTGDMAKGILSEVNLVVAQVFHPAANMIAQSFTLLAVVVLLIVIDPGIALIVGIVMVGTYGLIYVGIRRFVARIGLARAAANKARFEAAGEALSGIKDIKLLGREDAYLQRFIKPSLALARHESMNATLSQMPRFGIEAVAFGGIILLVLAMMARFGGHEEGALGHVIPLLGLYAFAGYRMLPAVQTIYGGLTSIRFGTAAVDALYTDLIQCEGLPPLAKKSPPPLLLRERLQLDAISYGYPNAERVGIHDVSFDIPAGSTVGIVGATGAGKTTLVDIILGLLTPSSGRLRVDGVEVTPANLRAWQANLGYVPQDIFLVDASVTENIALGVPPARIDHARVAECARLAQIHSFIETDLPEGYATWVGERGVRLSGGQRQRIGIARALYNDPQVIVFDEATSALDNLTEQEVMKAVGALSGTKTIIMIAHRLSTVRACDNIAVLDKGKLVAIGQYDDLADDNVHFRKMVEVSGGLR